MRFAQTFKMKKRIKKYIDSKSYVKVYLADYEGFELTSFGGIIVEQNEKFILMSDLNDFNFDGVVIVRKSDISNVKRSINESFFDTIIEKEGIKQAIIQRTANLNFKLGDFTEMFISLKELGIAIIIEQLYANVSKFQVGPVSKVDKKKVFLDYFNANGEFDFKPVTSKFKDITFVRIDSPYANLFFKHVKWIE